MTYVYRLLILVTLALLGGLIYSLTINFLIMGGLIATDSVSENFGQAITQKAVYVWIISVLIGLVGIFINKKALRMALFAFPFLAPSVFAVIYTLSSQ